MSMYNQFDKLLSPPSNSHVGTSSPVSHLAINLQFSSISLPSDTEPSSEVTSSPRSESKPEGRRPKVTPLILPSDENTCPQTRGNGSNPSPRAMRKLFPELDSPFPSRKNKSSHDETEPNKRLGVSTFLRSSDPGPLQFEDTPSPVPSPTPVRQKKKLSQSANSWSFDLTQDSLSCPSSPLPGQMRSANLPPRPPSRCRDRSISIAIQPNGTPDFSITSPISSIQASFTVPHSPIRDVQLRLPTITHPPFELPPITEVACPPTPPLSDDVPTPPPPIVDILPNTERDRMKFIEPSTLLDVLNGKYNCRHVIIDCRFKFEYDGGYIIGAINIHEQPQLETTFFSNVEEVQENCVLIFHCEFSSLRGPTLCQHLRTVDRATNIDCYPKLLYPHAYVLTGGYKRFYEEHPSFCFPNGYVTMVDPQFSSERKEKMTSLRKGKSLKGRFRSFSDLRSFYRETDNL